MSPVASAGSAKTFGPPFTNAQWTSRGFGSAIGCASVAALPIHYWGVNSGDYLFGINSTSSGGSACAGSGGDIQASIVVTLQIAFPTSGIHRVVVSWNVTPVTTLYVRGGPCYVAAFSVSGSCYRGASASLSAVTKLIDSGTGKAVVYGTSWLRYVYQDSSTTCGSSGCSNSTSRGTLGFTHPELSLLTCNVTGHHAYLLQLTLVMQVDTYDTTSSAISTGSTEVASYKPSGPLGIGTLDSVRLY